MALIHRRRLNADVTRREGEVRHEYITSHELGHFLSDRLTSGQRSELQDVIMTVATANKPPQDRFVAPGRQAGVAVRVVWW